MKHGDAPQDDSSTLEGQKKPLYVVNSDGVYTTELSSGWEAEEVVLDLAINQFQHQCQQARLRVEQGKTAPLEYHMYQRRMDITVLAQSTGFFKFQVKRHLQPAIFSKLSVKKLARYQQALGMTSVELQTLPLDEQQP
ncbi:MAG: hypothetical protein DRQ60_08655 [Gammaproteobacteria bacterium]|nr:MAG: hypothetical protein DRQ54_07450 [Gammaproteobacteria bacterium]RLA12261.1 MAG: hypothetical protein DRQ52_08240 [Gammaproteobacteria bacterium]RLA12463.1 MAG: hypothetical protein DRQ60_08655 [Gammaproteobacteria bacterium]